jgi:hypothetical protein
MDSLEIKEQCEGELMAILANLCLEMGVGHKITLTDWVSQIEQLFQEPQQPDKSLEQKIRGALARDCKARDWEGQCEFKKCPCAGIGDLVAKILALIPVQQPEGELAENPYPARIRDYYDETYIPNPEHDGYEEGSKSQRAFMLSQGYRKLPSEEEFPEMLRRATETALSKNKLGIVDNFDLIAQELLRLLGEKP